MHWGSSYNVSLVVLAGVLTTAVSHADAGADAAADTDAGGVSCTNTDDCAVPTPYCDPGRHTCVECLSDRNCASTTGLCDVLRGVCVPCFSDADCATPDPYCSVALERCVECRTDSNCADDVSCKDGLCGTCGDGVCGSRERTMLDFFGPPSGSPLGRVIQCSDDCAKFCGEIDLGSAVNISSVTLSAHNRFSSGCGGLDGPDQSFKWTAPATGTYYIDAIGSSHGTIMIMMGDDVCSYANGCRTGVDTYPAGQDFVAGEKLFFALDTDESASSATYVLNIRDHCEGDGCSDGRIDSGAPDSGSSNPTAACLANATSRGDTMCAGVECACDHCPQGYDDCAVVPECDAIRGCMQAKACVGADCYNSGACRGIIDSHGGLSGAAFRAAATLQSCALSYGCKVPCASDAGPACAAGRTVVCKCDGGVSGQQVCAADGESFEPCSCEPRAQAATDDGCACRMGPRKTRQSHIVYLLLASAGLWRVRRVRRGAEEMPS